MTLRTTVLMIAVAAAGAPLAHAQMPQPAPPQPVTADVRPAALAGVSLRPQPNRRLPLDRRFLRADGSSVALGEILAGTRPALLALVYFDCPLLCGQVLEGVIRGLRPIRLTMGRDFDLIVLSFDPRDTPAKAAVVAARRLHEYGRDGAGHGLSVLTGQAGDIDAVTEAAGFHLTFDPATGQFQHPSAIVALTPDGRVSRYLSSVEFGPRDLQLALVEASAGRVGSLVDRFVLYCYQYDPATGRYGLMTFRLLRLGGLVTVAALVGLIGTTWWRERRGAGTGGRA